MLHWLGRMLGLVDDIPDPYENEPYNKPPKKVDRKRTYGLLTKIGFIVVLLVVLPFIFWYFGIDRKDHSLDNFAVAMKINLNDNDQELADGIALFCPKKYVGFIMNPLYVFIPKQAAYTCGMWLKKDREQLPPSYAPKTAEVSIQMVEQQQQEDNAANYHGPVLPKDKGQIHILDKYKDKFNKAVESDKQAVEESQQRTMPINNGPAPVGGKST